MTSEGCGGEAVGCQGRGLFIILWAVGKGVHVGDLDELNSTQLTCLESARET